MLDTVALCISLVLTIILDQKRCIELYLTTSHNWVLAGPSGCLRPWWTTPLASMGSCIPCALEETTLGHCQLIWGVLHEGKVPPKFSWEVACWKLTASYLDLLGGSKLLVSSGPAGVIYQTIFLDMSGLLWNGPCIVIALMILTWSFGMRKTSHLGARTFCSRPVTTKTCEWHMVRDN